MTRLLKRGDSVLEPACGPATLAGHLPSGVTYFGFDTNKSFIAHAKEKSRNVMVGNAMEKKNYKKSDYVIAVDILHHLPKEMHEKFLTLCFDACEKAFIMCEPTESQDTTSFFHPIKKYFIEWFEQDGENDMSVHSGFDPVEYDASIKSGFGGVIPSSVKREVERMGTDTIVTFYKN